MRRSTLLLSIALLASVASAAWFWQALRVERAHSAELGAQLERQDIELQRVAEVAADAIEEPTPAPAATPETPVQIVPAPASSTKVVIGSKQDWRAHQRQLMSDPKYREARRVQERLKYAPRRANLIRLLGFTPEQADATIDLDIDQEMQQEGYPTRDTAEAQKEANARYEALRREREDKLRALLGEEKRQRLQGYMESRESRMQVDALRTGLTEMSALRDDQVEPLIAALHVERARMQSELREYRDTLDWEGVNHETWRLWGERKTELLEEMNARMHSSASSLLTNAQLDALDEQLRQELAQHEARQSLSRIQTKLQQASPPATPN